MVTAPDSICTIGKSDLALWSSDAIARALVNHEFEGLRALEDERGNDDCHAPSAIQRHETAPVPLWLD
jgi:hypothetical protein